MTKAKVTNPSRLWTPYFDLNEKVWFDFDTSKLPDGPVSSWTEATGNLTVAQSTAANQPVMSAASGGLVFSGGTKQLVIPNVSLPTRLHRTVAMMFQAAVSTSPNSSGSFVSFNGTSGSADNRAPWMGYVKGTPNQVNAQWATTSTLAQTATDNAWSFAISRRVQGVHHFQLNGGTELTDGTNVLIPRNTTALTGVLGDFRASTVTWILKRLFILQNELTDDERDRFTGWAMWSMGVQASLPGGHPYASAPPTTKRWGNPYPVTTDQQFADSIITPNWFNTSPGSLTYKQNYSNPIASIISGWTQDFLEDFTSISVLGNETDAPGGAFTVFAPSIEATGGTEVPRNPTQSPDVFSQAGSELLITMQQVAGTGPFYSSSVCSVNIDGRGYTYDPSKAPYYIEYRVRIVTGNGVGLWTALWMKPLSEFFNGTTGHYEWDLCETYNGESSGENQHVTIHSWPPPRLYPGHNASHQFGGHDMILDVAHVWPGAPVSLYDNTTHTIACIIDKNLTGTTGTGFVVACLDGNELLRFPLQHSMLQPSYIIASFAQLPSEAGSAAGTYTLAIDSIKVLKGPNY